MSKNRSYDRKESLQEETVQNEAPALMWPSFDAFWSACVKNGTPAIKAACVAHLKSIGSWDDPEKWIDGVLHFGVPLEK